MAAQRTPLYDAAVRSGASFTETYGWELPRHYGDVLAEYTAACEGVVVHDASYFGRLRATGEDVLDLINRLSTNEVVSLQPGQGAPTVLTTDRGRILDLITVLNLDDHILVGTSPETRDRVIEWIDKYTIADDATFEDVTNDTAMLSLSGPGGESLLSEYAVEAVKSLDAYGSTNATIAGVETVAIRKGLAGLAGFDLVMAAGDAESVWGELTAAGAVPMGMEAYDVLRVEGGAPVYDRELGESFNPLETGLWGSISFTKGCYIGQEVIARLDTYQKVQKHLVRLSFSSGVAVEAGASLATAGREVGHVTSVVKLPTTGELVGMGYVRREAAEVGTQIGIGESDDAWARVEGMLLPFGPGDQPQ